MNAHIHFFPSITCLSLNLLKASLFLGCTLISVTAFNMSSVEDRNTPEYLNFFWSAYFHKESGSAAIAKKVVLLHSHKLGVQCTHCQCGAPWKQWSCCSGMVCTQWSVCMPGEDTQGAGGHCQNTLCYCQHFLPQVKPESTQGLSQRIVLAREIACTWAPWAPQPFLSGICPSSSSWKPPCALQEDRQRNCYQFCSNNLLIYYWSKQEEKHWMPCLVLRASASHLAEVHSCQGSCSAQKLSTCKTDPGGGGVLSIFPWGSSFSLLCHRYTLDSDRNRKPVHLIEVHFFPTHSSSVLNSRRDRNPPC